MEEEKFDIWLFLIILFFGWLGVDKFYVMKSAGWKLFLIKLISNMCAIGELWNILDLIMCIIKKYKADPREYLDYIENRRKK